MKSLVVILTFMAFLVTGCVTNNDADEGGDNYPYSENLTSITGLKFPLGWKPPEDAVFFSQGVGLPRNFDWREKGLSAVENQGSCGSCWAFATASVFEDNVKLATGKEVDFSEQYLVDCVKESSGCQGGWNAHDYHFKKGYSGAIAESSYPYKAKNGSCQSGHRPLDKIVEWKALSNDIDNIKHAIYNYGPVWTTIYATSAIQSYRSGVFKQCQSGQSNHAVTLVGWNDDGRYWVMKNSWSANWGEKGYMRIPYNCNNIGYGSNFVVYKQSPNPDPDPDPDPEPDPEPDPDPEPVKKCKYEKYFKSRSGGSAVTLKIQNSTKKTAIVYWLDTNGKRVAMYKLKAKKTVKQKSYVYHAWVATDSKGKCLGMFYPLTRYQTRWKIK